MFKTRNVIVLFGALLLIGCSQTQPGQSPGPAVDANGLISREVLFGNPDKAGPQISHDGTKISYLAPVNGVLNVWVGPADHVAAAKPVTQDTKRGIRQYRWAYTNQHIIYIQDLGGDENWHVYVTDLKSGKTRDLTPMPKVNAQVAGVSDQFPDEILVGLNDRNPQFHDIHRVNIRTGAMTLVFKNDGYAGFVIDDEFHPRLATKFTPDGGQEIYTLKDGAEGDQFAKISADDSLTTGPSNFDRTGHTLYMLDSRGRNTGALTSIDMESKQQTVLAEDARADAQDLIVDPKSHTVQAVAFKYERPNWKVLDPTIQGDLDYLKTVSEGDIDIGSRTLDDNKWVVMYDLDNGPVRYYLYDRASKNARFLFTNRHRLEGVKLAKMHPVVIKARDGLDLVCYYTVPVEADPDQSGKPAKPVAMVLDVHGGPWGRDEWGYNPTHQWLANRGYAVLSVNFRGSTGFGKTFVNAGNKEWAGRMHDDLLDAVSWAVKSGIADEQRVAIMGGSYGGYATLVGMTFTPDTFACGVDIVGPSNLITLLNSIPPYWAPMIDMFTTRVGDHRTEEGRSLLTQRSPLTHVDRIRKPLLIGQGANDPRVKQAEADQIVKAMNEKHIPSTYVLYSDEGHGFARPENRMSFNAVTEAFLAQHLHGRYEPIGRSFANSTIRVPNGSDQVPGVAEALAGHH